MRHAIRLIFGTTKGILSLCLVLLAAAALAANNLDSLLTVWHKYFGASDGLEPFADAVNKPSSVLSSGAGVTLDLVQAPREQPQTEQVYDLYLRNNTNQDVLLVSVAYANGVLYSSMNSGGQRLEPETTYTIPIEPRGGESALSPPFLLKRHSRGAVRLRFKGKPNGLFGSTALAFQIFDSSGNKVAAVNEAPGK